jgi:hypothetical protein
MSIYFSLEIQFLQLSPVTSSSHPTLRDHQLPLLRIMIGLTLIHHTSPQLQKYCLSRVQTPSVLASLFSTASAKDDFTHISVNEESGVAMLMLNRPPANSLSLEM